MNNLPPLLPGHFYHIYNRGNNREDIFTEAENYRYFLQRYFQYTTKVVDTYAYCLLKNHFHLLVRVKEEIPLEEIKPFRSIARSSAKQDLKGLLAEEEIPEFASQQFSNFFNSYSKSFNKRYGRSGSLFLKPFRRKEIDSDSYFSQVIAYIHLNPEKHKFVDSFRQYPYSSYNQVLSDESTVIKKDTVIDWFGGKEEYIKFHQDYRDFSLAERFIVED